MFEISVLAIVSEYSVELSYSGDYTLTRTDTPLRRTPPSMPTDPLRRDPPQCRQCMEPLTLERRHTSPERLGPQVSAEYWVCPRCDAIFVCSPAENRWRQIVT